MSAAELRQAASLMRERAEAATPGPWEARAGSWGLPSDGPDHMRVVRKPPLGASDAIARTEWERQGAADAEHIASWHSDVALAVADWLDGVALFLEAKADEKYFDLDGDPIAPEDTHAIGAALAVARAYLNTG